MHPLADAVGKPPYRIDIIRFSPRQLVIEGVAFDLYSNVRIAKSAGVKLDRLILNGGPTKSRFWNQITANVVNLPLDIPDVNEAAPLGDAILAGVGAGIYKDPVEPARSIATIRQTIEPDAAMHQRYDEFFELWSEVLQQLQGPMDRQNALLERYHLGQGA